MARPNKRKSITKKIRFEVFKRDKFQCQYCGRYAPDVILNVDHIKPIAKGGDNDISNLITSCFDCNSGKKDILLSDDSVIQKQRKQVELLQERKEQIELLMEWKNSLKDINAFELDNALAYLNDVIYPFTISESTSKKLQTQLKKYGLNSMINAIDESVKYLRYNINNELTEDSVNTMISKIGGILYLTNKPEVEQKVSYIKGICKNRFNYWDHQRGSILLNDYIKALRSKGYSEESILNDIENELIPHAKLCSNWATWRSNIEKWIDDINNW